MHDKYRKHSFDSLEEAVQFFAQQAEDRHTELQSKLLAIEFALQAIFRFSSEAAGEVLTLAERFEEREAPDRLRLMTAVASELRRFTSMDAQEVEERVQMSVIEGGLSTDK